MGADEDLGGKGERVEEVLVGELDSFAFGVAHEVEVDGLASDDGAERTVFHNNHVVAKLGDEEGGLGGDRGVRRGNSDGILVRGDNLTVY